MLVYCNRCNKEFTFDDLPSDRSVFCPDCGSQAIIVDTAGKLQQEKTSNPYINNRELNVKTKTKKSYLNPFIKKRFVSGSQPVYNARKVLILSSIGAPVGIIGIGHLYIKKLLKGVCFLVGGFFFYLTLISFLSYYHWNRAPETPENNYSYIFFLIVYCLIWFWQFYDLNKLTNRFRNVT